MSIFKEILQKFQNIPCVVAIAIGGSITAKTSDLKSDIDVYIFVEKNIPIEQRKEIIYKYAHKYEIGGEYFGLSDEFFVDMMQQQLDFMYWDINWLKQNVEDVWVKHYPSNGYTTAFLYTLNNFQIFYDRDGLLNNIQKIIKTDYPEELKQNIIKRNMMLMKDKPFASYYEQIEKAINRNDTVSINHRIAAFMASYFDVLFAKNELLHPGEKRLVSYAINNCKILPQDFEENINNLLCQPNTKTLSILSDMVEKLRVL